MVRSGSKAANSRRPGSRYFSPCVRTDHTELRYLGPTLAQVAGATDPQEGGEIQHLPAKVHDLFVEPGDQLVGGHAVGFGDLAEDIPELVFQAQGGHHATDAQRTGTRFVENRISLDVELAHDPPPPLQRDPGTQQSEERRQPTWMRRPGRSSSQVALDVGLGHFDIDITTTGQPHFRSTGRISAALTTVENPRRRQ